MRPGLHDPPRPGLTEAGYRRTQTRSIPSDLSAAGGVWYHPGVSAGAALLRAIRDMPDEDTPRLMYADFLQEEGDPARAELIRVQVERARLADR